MAKRTLYATKNMRDPLYRTRMLKAGQPLELDGPTARLYLHLGVATDKKPTRAAENKVLTGNDVYASPETTQAVQPKPKAAPRKRTTRRKK